MKIIFSLLVFLICFNAKASYHVATFDSDIIDYQVPTRLLVAGNGDDLGLQFQYVAKAKALKYHEQNSNEQIVFIAINEKELGSEWSLKRLGFKIIRNDNNTLDGKEFLKEAVRFKKILSLDIFSHSSAQFGIHLDGKAHRLNVNTRGLETLKSSFTKDAYVYLHGCNSGFNLAPHLSNVWEVPVAGSLTSTNFQKLHVDSHFYLTEEGMAPSSQFQETNMLSYDVSKQCKDGACIRLKPDNTPYYGFWGSYREGGLPFYKFFCVKNTDEHCLKIMAKSLLSHTLIVNLKKDSDFSTFKKAVVDWLCPVSSKKDLRNECESKLDEALITKDYTYNPFSRAQIECSTKGCKAEIKCDKIFITGFPKPGTCKLSNNINYLATTLVREYEMYLAAYRYLK